MRRWTLLDIVRLLHFLHDARRPTHKPFPVRNVGGISL
jgi:hypothetical protein